MSKTLKITITIILIILILGLLGFVFIYKNKNGDTGIDIIKNISPFGKNINDTVPIKQTKQTNSNADSSGWIGNASKPKLFQIHKKATAGFYAFKNTDDDMFVRDIERGVGNIFETDMQKLKEKRISNITRLKIQEAIWGNNGKNVVIRYTDDKNTIRSFIITLKNTTDNTLFNEEIPTNQNTKEIQGLFLPENITEVTPSKQDDKKIFYLFNFNNSSFGIIYNLDTGKKAQIFQSPITEWLPQWPNKEIITLTTKPAGSVDGFMYFLNTKTENLDRILGNIKGLTTLTSPDAKKVLYSKSTDGWVSLYIYNITKHSSIKLPVSTLPEKCAWSKTDKNTVYCAIPNNPKLSNYPDQWYKGLISFSDDIWKINTETYATERILSPIDTVKEDFDIINLQISNDDNFLFFKNKKDMSLWGMKLMSDKKIPLD